VATHFFACEYKDSIIVTIHIYIVPLISLISASIDAINLGQCENIFKPDDRS